MIAGLAAWAIEALIASALLMSLVLLLRAPVRRLFGAQVAYALWALPALRMLLPPLPEAWREVAPVTPLARAGEALTLIVLPAAPAGSATAPLDAAAVAGPSLVTLAIGAWAGTALLFLGFQLWRHRRFCNGVLASGHPVDRVARVRIIESAAAPGPIAFGIVRPYVAVPRDFADRYDADERALALAHELGHHARGDLAANWLALVILALHWFNPLAWRAHTAFRADQELANDARVLAGRSLYDRHAYACAIVKTAHGGALSAACHLHSVEDLKGRLKMLRTQVSRSRLFAGAATVACVTVAALGFTASGTRAAESVRATVADKTGITLPARATEPATPTEPTEPAEPLPPTAASPGRHSRVVIVRDGHTTTYDGVDADAFLAARSSGDPARPPEPPMPPVRASAAARASADAARIEGLRAAAAMPRIVSGDCGGRGAAMVMRERRGDGGAMVICTDRIERAARQDAVHAVDAERVQRDAMAQALAGLRLARATVAENRAMIEQARREALRSIDDSIVEMEREAALD